MSLLITLRLGLITCLFSLITMQAQNTPASPAIPPPAARAANVIEKVEFQGMSRVPVDTLKALVRSKAGDVYNDAAVKRDFNALWNTARFDDIRLKTEKGERGGLVVSFFLTERP
jgi:outer membrane protein assembly factor BamA